MASWYEGGNRPRLSHRGTVFIVRIMLMLCVVAIVVALVIQGVIRHK